MAISIFPALSQWNDESFAKNLKYQLITLSNAIGFNIDLLLAHQLSISDQNLLSVKNLRHNSVQLIGYLQTIDLESCLKLANSLLKLKIVNWKDVNNLLFPDTNMDAIQTAWSLGLTTIAREMCSNDSQKFYQSIAYNNSEGLVTAINGKRFTFSKFIIEQFSLKWFLDYQVELDYITKALIDAENWELLYQLYETEKKYFTVYHLIHIAETGKIEGLHLFRKKIKNEPRHFAWSAAEHGQVEFLNEMDSMNMFTETSTPYDSVVDAFKGAVRCSSSECLAWLIKRFGKSFLCSHIGFDKEKMLIHIAAESGNSETLRTVMRYYPFYKKISLKSSVTTKGSPLHFAVKSKNYGNVQFLLENFPEFIKFQDWNGNTALHEAITTDCRILRMLLDVAPRKIITARNNNGNTVLHLAVLYSKLEMISLLMNTGHFTGMERNNRGITPAYQLSRFR